jgi:hypothetical protein
LNMSETESSNINSQGGY